MEEYNTNSPIPKLNLQREQKLQIFAVMSALKTIPVETLKTSFSLSLLLTYSAVDAVVASRQIMEGKGMNPELYYMDCMVTSMPVEAVIALPEVNKPVPTPVVEPTKPQETVEEFMIRNVRMVFNMVGDKKEQEMAEKVIARFTTEIINKGK